MGKVHGSLTRAGKVRGQTPKVAKKEDKPKKAVGRVKFRRNYIKRFVRADPTQKFRYNAQTLPEAKTIAAKK